MYEQTITLNAELPKTEFTNLKDIFSDIKPIMREWS